MLIKIRFECQNESCGKLIINYMFGFRIPVIYLIYFKNTYTACYVECKAKTIYIRKKRYANGACAEVYI